MDTGRCCSWDTCAFRMTLPATWLSWTMEDSSKTGPQLGLLGHHWHVWRRAGPGRPCRHTTSLAKTFLPPADGSPSPPGSRAAPALPAAGSDPKSCLAAGRGIPHGCSPNALLTALTYQASDESQDQRAQMKECRLHPPFLFRLLLITAGASPPTAPQSPGIPRGRNPPPAGGCRVPAQCHGREIFFGSWISTSPARWRAGCWIS